MVLNLAQWSLKISRKTLVFQQGPHRHTTLSQMVWPKPPSRAWRNSSLDLGQQDLLTLISLLNRYYYSGTHLVQAQPRRHRWCLITPSETRYPLIVALSLQNGNKKLMSWKKGRDIPKTPNRALQQNSSSTSAFLYRRLCRHSAPHFEVLGNSSCRGGKRSKPGLFVKDSCRSTLPP